ncbi:MAG TPA: ATP-binding protein, partial [Saprospiraceae bacterium]|nr:ATP-binding protein [Saprospiraceae bacterium]
GVGGGILEDPEGRLWIQGGEGYLWLDEQKEKFESVSPLSHQTTFVAIRPGRGNMYWGHRSDDLLCSFSLSKGQQDCYWLPPGSRITAGIFNWQLPYFLLLDENNGLIRYYPESRKIERFSLRHLFAPSTTISLNQLFHDEKGRVWIGSVNGLICAELTADGKDYTYRLWSSNTEEGRSLSDKQVNFIQDDPDDPDVIWIGTQHGLNRLDNKTGSIRQFKQTDGWPNDVICGVLKGRGPQLWVSTYYGLIELNTRTFQWRHFTIAHGLPANEFNRGGAFRQKNGRLVFGGVNGLVCFYPEDIPQSDFRPRILLTRLLVNNTSVEPNDGTGILKEAISVTPSITLDHDQSNLVFHFALLDYLNTSWNRYYYKLEGVDDTWQYNGSETRIQYVNLAPGNYRFWVKARNSDGYWSGPAGINITIRPPWWQTLWAYTFFAAGILFLIWLGLRLWIKQVRLRDRLAVQQMEADRLKELDNFRSELYANITHEFRTPLTMIIGLADQLDKRLEGEQKEKTTLLARSGQQLLRLVNQILDLSRIEQRHLQLNLVQQDIVGFIGYLGESYASLAQQKGIGFRIDSRMKELVMDVDPQRLHDIMDNLISNAFKFTPRGGQVNIILERLERPDRLHLIVEDSGIGIESEHLAHIFERYYQANRKSLESPGGSGIGLAYARALVEMMDGTLSVKSTPGEGSSFSVDLPIRRQAPSARALVPATTEHSIPPEGKQEAPAEQLPLVLVVEDNEDVAAFIASCLTGYYQVRMAGNGTLGEEMALEIIPDVVISDISMPDRNGLELCRNLKNDRRTS